MKVSLLVPFSAQRPGQILPWAALAQWTGASLWQGTGGATDPLQTLTFAAGSGFAVPGGIGVALMPNQHPFDLAVRAVTTALATGHPLTIGVGPAARVAQAAFGAPYGSVLTAADEYLTILTALLEKGTVEFAGDYWTAHAALPQTPRPRVDAGLGVLRPGMARVAGLHGARPITWLTPASYLRDTIIPRVRGGAAEADRPCPPIVAIVPAARRSGERDVRELVARGNANHISRPHYRDMLRQAGIDLEGGIAVEEQAQRIADGGAFLFGDDDELRAGVRAYAEAGVDELVVNTAGVLYTEGPHAALAEAEALLELLS
ncbi:LLM class flavin-dependent oxidoreductase [Microbacterium hibisci]|uniref:LLM class flavin-dependent oxidoreductase n=1 Tax=Microbacterium hibisci TaxID=2036000 RepID=UPI001941F2FC|nr:LLM class flavin-dependent oxidoreductase [Microbacterium hibisci]